MLQTRSRSSTRQRVFSVWQRRRQRRNSASAHIILSGGHEQDEGTAVGTTIGTLSVVGVVLGTYTFTKMADPDSAFTLTGSTLKNAIIFDYETKTSHSVTIQGNSDNGGDPVLTLTVTIQVGDVVDVAPAFTVDPAATGTPTEGETLSVDNGTVTGTAPITFSYQWKQADPLAPVNLVAPVASGTPTEGETLSVDGDEWQAVPPDPTDTYQWLQVLTDENGDPITL